MGADSETPLIETPLIEALLIELVEIHDGPATCLWVLELTHDR
jgi:hypothetical protein